MGRSAQATIEAVSESEGARLQLTRLFPLTHKSLFLKVSQAIPQKQKMDSLVDWAAELGIQELWVTETKRSIVKMKGESRERARKRWERIVIEACKQSRSPVLTRIEGPLPLEQVIQEKVERFDRAFLFHPDSKGMPFSEWIQSLQRLKAEEHPVPLFLFFGPEGGFSEEEVKKAQSRGIQKVFLGESTLRVEVAFLGVLGALRFLVG